MIRFERHTEKRSVAATARGGVSVRARIASRSGVTATVRKRIGLVSANWRGGGEIRIRHLFFDKGAAAGVAPYIAIPGHRTEALTKWRLRKREEYRARLERQAKRRATDPFRVGETQPGERTSPRADWSCPQWQVWVSRGWSPEERRERFGLVPKAFRRRVLSHVRTYYGLRWLQANA